MHQLLFADEVAKSWTRAGQFLELRKAFFELMQRVIGNSGACHVRLE